jgi:phospholipase C
MVRRWLSWSLMVFGAWLPARAFHSRSEMSQPPEPSAPVCHVVVIWQENQSFDHYFATYPRAENLPGEPPFHAAPDTATVNGLSEALRTHNPNLQQPWRISRSKAVPVIAGVAFL